MLTELINNKNFFFKKNLTIEIGEKRREERNLIMQSSSFEKQNLISSRDETNYPHTTL